MTWPTTHGQPEATYQWLTMLAREGDVFAMPVLIEDGGEIQVRARLWMHLSSMLDRELSQYRYEAITDRLYTIRRHRARSGFRSHPPGV